MKELRAETYATDVLEIGYRCPPEVTEIAQTLREVTPSTIPSSPAPSVPSLQAAGVAEPLVFRQFYSQCHLVLGVIESLRDLQDRDATARLAVIARSRPAALRIGAELQKGLPVRILVDGNVDMSPGITVTCVQEVKGLEFDVVVIPDASDAVYPATPESRRTLYVAVTRANQQLLLASPGPWSPMLAPIAAARGLREPKRIAVRRAQPADDHAIGELLVDAYVTGYARKMPEVVVNDQRKADLRAVAAKREIAEVFVAESDGEIVGTVAVFPPGAPGSEAWLPNAVDLRHLATHPRVHGRGYSRALLDEAERYARIELHADAVCLHVRKGNLGVARLYMGRGYVRDPAGDLNLPEITLEAYALRLKPPASL